MFEDLFEDILDEKREEEVKEEEFNEVQDFELFRDEQEPQEVPDFWTTSNVNVDDADIWSTDEVWNTAN